ncbi:MAG TPA: hypothetical protein DET40_20620 [Lentisphaeria bacterium]|nr:MAG: hypothetical protein A2X45_16145 [Lentisphaerae bacterium GWF2_50_93]HCE45957.1 hypothetical protein [Lentisphaeria bacterium]
MKTIAIITAVICISFIGCTSTDSHSIKSIDNPEVSHYHLSSQDISPLAENLLKIIADDKMAVKPINLPVEINERDFSGYESVSILPPLAMKDGCTHTIYISSETNQYWILRTGGIAGLHQLFGPGIIGTVK